MVRNWRSAAFATLVAAMLPQGALAQILTGSCTVVVHNQGKITLNPSGSELSSKNGGGASVRATVTTQAGLLCTLLRPLLCYGVSAPSPLLFASSPLDGSIGTVFSSTYRVGNGAEQPGLTKTQLQDGSYNVEINLSASKVLGTFGAGDYRAEVLILCE